MVDPTIYWDCSLKTSFGVHNFYAEYTACMLIVSGPPGIHKTGDCGLIFLIYISILIRLVLTPTDLFIAHRIRENK